MEWLPVVSEAWPCCAMLAIALAMRASTIVSKRATRLASMRSKYLSIMVVVVGVGALGGRPFPAFAAAGLDGFVLLARGILQVELNLRDENCRMYKELKI